MKKILSILLIGVLTLSSLVGCASNQSPSLISQDDDKAPQQQKPMGKMMAANIVGEVMEISEDGTRILVESKNPYESTDSSSSILNGNVWVIITEETSFMENLPQGMPSAYRDVSRDFQIGNHVELVTLDDVNESTLNEVTTIAVYVNEIQ